MPNCFTLTPKGEKKPEIFSKIDDEMREFFGAEPDADSWLHGWYDSVGTLLALGKTWDEQREIFGDDCPEILAVIDYLEKRYETNAWYQR